jgi:putrescine aminotransferase
VTALSSSRDVLDLYRSHLSSGRARLSDMLGGQQEVTSHRAYIYDADGNRYLSCGGYGVFLLGHTHPAIVDAVVKQARSHPLATRLLLEPVGAHAAAALIGVAPTGLRKAHFVNSGAEATEAALKLARANGKTKLVSAIDGYHGKTMGALTLTANDLYQAPFRPLLPDVKHVPYGDVDALAAVVAADTCVVLEPVQGEGGVRIPPAGYLATVAELCRRRDALLVLDEIQTGMGRLGRWWGADFDDISPDVLLVAKGLSGGVVPVAAMLATEEVYAPFDNDPFLHTSTFGGSPIAMAAAKAAVETIAAEGLVERSAALGDRIMAGLAPLVGRCVVEVRGRGLLIGIEMRDEGTAGSLVLELLERGVLVSHSLNAHSVVRLTPPAVMSDQDVDWLLSAATESVLAVEELT